MGWHTTEEPITARGFWSRIGASLQALQIEFVEDCKDDVRDIMRYCRNLEEVHIQRSDWTRADDEILVQCITSFGSQLDYLGIPNLNSANVGRVLEACSRARIRIDLPDDISGHVLQAAASRLDSVTAHSVYIFDLDIWSMCRSLREMDMFVTTSAELQKVFSSPLRSLEKLTAVFRAACTATAISDLLTQIAYSTGALRMVKLGAYVITQSGFGNVVRSNHSPEIAEIFMRSLPLDDVTALIVRALLKAPKLLHLRIAQSAYPYLALDHTHEDYSIYPSVYNEEVRNTCNSIRLSSRRVRVRVFGFYYL